MLYYDHPDQTINRKDAYILIVICAVVYNKERPIDNIENVYRHVARLVNLDIERMKKAMNVIALRYCGTNYTKLDYYIIMLANCLSTIDSKA